MRIAVVGAGAAGLLFSLLVKRRFPAWEVQTFEQNPEGATYGFGVVFSDGALAFLQQDEPELSRFLEAAMERWPMQRIVHRDERVDVDGNGFSAIGRLALQEMLQRLCRRAGASIRYGRTIGSLGELSGADLVVGADGANSLVRSTLAAQFVPSLEVLTNRFAWYGTAQPFDCLTLTFRESEHGAFVAHHYRHSAAMSTFVVECTDATWRKAGLDRMGDAESRAYCELSGADLVVGADGSNSLVRNTLAEQFVPSLEVLTNRFAWYGTAQPFDCLTLTFRESEHGAFVAHHYRHSAAMSTFVVECTGATLHKAGLDRMSDAESRAYCERVFAADLGGHGLVSNKSLWRQFPLVRNERWIARRPLGYAVLLGDALRTVHFSIGSGTRLAFEDAIALERAFSECGDDLERALESFERERRPIVDKILAAANASSYWYEKFPEKMELEPWRLAYDYMTRSGRMTEERLRVLAPKFMARVGAERRGN